MEKYADNTDQKQSAHISIIGAPIWLLICAVCLVLGIFLGYYCLDNSSYISLDGKTSLSISELDSVIATYTYKGKVYTITPRDIITQSTTVSDAMNDNAMFDVPSSDDILGYAQNRIVLYEAEESGLSVSDEEVGEFSVLYYGTDDYSQLAETYGVDEDTVLNSLRESALLYKFECSVVSVEIPQFPSAPKEPNEGEEDTPTLEYAAYVVSLLGDAWDLVADRWAQTDGDYYEALSGYEFSGTSATYEVAAAAYAVAYNQYLEAYAQMTDEWTTYMNTLLAHASIQIGTLVL